VDLLALVHVLTPIVAAAVTAWGAVAVERVRVRRTEAQRVHTPARMPLPEPGKPRVLLVEDQRIDRELATKLLELEGLEVYPVAGGDEARALVDSGLTFAAIVSDERLDAASGAALMAELRARQTPRLILYSGIDPEDLRRVLRLHRLDAVVAKPDAARMVAAVRGRAG
jgi:CheY-like chemotaxis protein